MTDAAPMKENELLVREEVVKKLHQDFDERYELANIRTSLPDDMQPLLEGISQDELNMLKDFFFNTIYPKIKDRYERDKSFESMTQMLKHPTRLGRIIPSFPSLFIKYARIWPTAINVGINAMMAYLLSLRIETLMTREILRLAQQNGTPVRAGFALDQATYDTANRRISISNGKRMLNAAMRVMQAGKNPELVNATYSILNDVQDSLARIDTQRQEAGTPPIYTDPIKAMDFGKNVLDQVKTVFGELGDDKLDRIIQITQHMELEHLQQMHSKA